jgi:predicted N-formylglutamate amidohydrolase
MRLSDGAVLPGNAGVDEAEVQRRIARFYDPSDAAISAAIRRALAAGHPPVVATVHSFHALSGAAGRAPGMWASCGTRTAASPGPCCRP